MDSIVCSGKNCPKEVYRSHAVYKYHGCQLSTSRTTSKSLLASTPLTSTYKTNTSNSIIAGAVIPVLVVILLVVLGVLFWKKKRQFVAVSEFCCLCRGQMNSTEETCEAEKFIEDQPEIVALEKNTPKELDGFKDFISDGEEYLETSKMVAFFGKLGTGKRTLATQIAIRLAKKEHKCNIRSVGERDLISKDFSLMPSTILIIHDPVKTCYTVRYTEEIISCLLKICKNARKNDSYIIVIFHHDDLNSLYRQFGKMQTQFESMFKKKNVFHIPNSEQTFKEIAAMYDEKFSNDDIKKIQKEGSSVGQFIMLTFYQKTEFHHEQFLLNPVKSIVDALNTLEMSSDIHNQLAFKLMVYIILHGGEIAKSRLKDIPHHALFGDLRENMDGENAIKECIKSLIDLYVGETADGGSYRVLHDIITKCTFLSAVKNHMTLLFEECDPIPLLDCIRLKSKMENLTNRGKMVYDYGNLKIAIRTEDVQAIVKVSFERKEIMDAMKDIRLFENGDFRMEWNKEYKRRLNNKGVKHTTVT